MPSVNIILDTDISEDCDDTGALSILHTMADNGECAILGVVVNTSVSGANAAAATINAYHKRPTIPVSQIIGGPNPGSSYDSTLASSNYYDPSSLSSLTPVQLYRSLLASQPNSSVTIVSIGFLENLSALLTSAADGYSGLTGSQLVAAKVSTLVIMGGQYPTSSGSAEFNFAGVPASSSAVVSTWPTPITFIGYELGNAVTSGSTLSTATPTDNPTRVAYTAVVGAGNARPSWDVIAAYYAVRGLSHGGTTYFSATTGTNSVNASTGNNTFTAGSGNQQYLSLVASASTVGAVLDTLLTTAPTSHQYPYRLTGAWEFNESSGTTILDSSLNANNGSIVGTVTRSPTGAINFSGNAGEVQIPDAPQLRLPATASHAWVVRFNAPSSFSGGNVDGFWTLLAKDRDDFSVNSFYFIGAEQGVLSWTQGIEGGSPALTQIPTFSNQTAMSAGAHVLVAVQNGIAGTRTLYLDGTSVATGTALPGGTGSSPLWIGCGASTTEYWESWVDGVRLYNYTPTLADVATLSAWETPLPVGYSVTTIPNGYAATASSAATVNFLGNPSTGVQTITITSGNGSDLITPSVGSSGTGSVTVTPTTGSTSFTFTVTRSTSGTSTISFSNGQGWSDVSSETYTTFSASPTSTATSTGATLNAGVMAGASPYTYSWTGSGITFSSTTIASPTATVSAFGTYTANVTVTDSLSHTTSGSTNFTLTAVASSLTVSPSTATVPMGSSKQFTATVLDQFGNTMVGASVAWSRSSATDGISSGGLYSATVSTIITAQSGSAVGTAYVYVPVQVDMTEALPSTPLPNSVGEALFFADLMGGRVNVAQGGTSTTITLDASASSDTNAYVGDDIYFYGGTGGGARGSGQRRTIVAYNTSTKVATVQRAWDTNPDNTTKFITLPQPQANVGLWNNTAVAVALPVSGTLAGQGSQMDLINAPNSTAITAIQSGLATATTLTAVKTKTDLIATNSADSPNEVTAQNTIGTNLNATVASRSTFAGGAVASVTAPVQVDMTQVVPTSNTVQTTGDALNAARADGFGKWVFSGTTLTLYAADGTTAVKTFTLNSSTNPTSRS